MRASRTSMVAVLLAPWWLAGPAGAACQTGIASAPYIGAADMRRIVRAAARLPRTREKIEESIGAHVPASVARKPVPAAVAKVLPQYKYSDYSAFRFGGGLAIANREGTLSYVLPLSGTGSPANCP